MEGKLQQVSDLAAQLCKAQMHREGALKCDVYQEGPFRVIYSIEPNDDGSVSHHVSVSRNHVSVNNRTLDEYAARVIPEFASMEREETHATAKAAHAWFREKVAT